MRNSSALAQPNIAAIGLVAPPPLQVEFPAFSGSLAQLFACVRDRRINLLDIPLLPICEAYFQYLLAQERPDLNEGATALAALAYLLERKAWALLPLPIQEEEESEPSALVDRTIHEYFEAVEFLRSGFDARERLHFRSVDPSAIGYEIPFEVESLELSALGRAFQLVLERAQPAEMPSVTRIGRALIDEMKQLLGRFGEGWRTLQILVEEHATREDVVYVFLSLLELIRLGQIQTRLVDGDVEFSRA